ncbi:flagellar basal body rod protein FlgB [bacterium]|nr:flagellar basal body rod protein FlgB [bacterium]MBU1072954.1 flagellar basal body rod protein FlgB [bacterium]MBU1674904.1 flagellar basal body rod protein FlgB [bacterium]
MFDITIFDHAHLDHLKKALTVYTRRHRVVSENIANVETAGYRAQEYRFEELLRKAGRGGLRGTQTHAAHMPIGARSLRDTEGETAAQDGGYDNGINDVDVDSEMTSLATTELSYRLATRVLSMKYNQLREAVSGRVR